jgi:uncharacterized protein (TIGR02145 family)
MKRALLLITCLCFLKASAQNYLINFTGNGASNTVSSVKVENVTAGTSLIISGSDVLRLTFATNANSIDAGNSSVLIVYPNPMNDKSIVQISPPQEGNAIITIFDISGKSVTQTTSYLEHNMNEFSLSGLKNGFYIISVEGHTYKYSGKLLSNGRTDGSVNIKKLSNNQAHGEKSKQTDHKGVQAIVDMIYKPGDRLKFTGLSGKYSTIKTDIPVSDKTINFNFLDCKDADNINYPVVEIGTQIWMAENLKTTKYRNSELIGTTSPAILDIRLENTPKYQWAYGGDESNVGTYGRLYTWFALTDIRNVCPTDWHVPTDNEWTTLTDYLTIAGFGFQGSGNDIAKSIANTSGWPASSTAGTIGNDQKSNNSSGFTALPGGWRSSTGTFTSIDGSGFWWSNVEYNSTTAYYRVLYSFSNILSRDFLNKWSGFAVRCLKDQ